MEKLGASTVNNPEKHADFVVSHLENIDLLDLRHWWENDLLNSESFLKNRSTTKKSSRPIRTAITATILGHRIQPPCDPATLHSPSSERGKVAGIISTCFYLNYRLRTPVLGLKMENIIYRKLFFIIFCYIVFFGGMASNKSTCSCRRQCGKPKSLKELKHQQSPMTLPWIGVENHYMLVKNPWLYHISKISVFTTQRPSVSS